MALRLTTRQDRTTTASHPGATLIETGKASRAQWARTPLATDFLLQCALSWHVDDVITYPILAEDIYHGAHTTADALVRTMPDAYGRTSVIAVCLCDDGDPRRRGPEHRPWRAFVRGWAAKHGIQARWLGTGALRTPYLGTARRLAGLAMRPTGDSPATRALVDLLGPHGAKTLGAACEALVEAGFALAEAKDAIDTCIATGEVVTHMFAAIGDHSMLQRRYPGRSRNAALDPMMVMLRAARRV